MHHHKVNQLLKALDHNGQHFEPQPTVEVPKGLWDNKSEDFLAEAFEALGGSGPFPKLGRLKVDFQIDRTLYLFDDEVHFNRYRLSTLKTSVYKTFVFVWQGSYERLCRQFEKQCLQAGLQQRIWTGPPLAARCFGQAEEPGVLTGNGSPGWKLTAYNDLQYDLITRLMGYKIARISGYENLLVGGTLRKLDQLLLRPNEATLEFLGKWLLRKSD